MEALAGVSLRDRAAFLEDTLVVADLHFGMSAAANLDAPVGAETDMIDRVAALCRHFDAETVVLAGDVLHSFDSVPPLVADRLDDLVNAVANVGAAVVATPGNHDTMLDSIWEGKTTDEFRVGDSVVCHGHEEPMADVGRYMTAHDHPTITIEGHSRPCFLAGDGVYGDADLLVLPAFNRLVSGATINSMTGDDFMSPLVTSADALAPVVRDEERDETLTFPPLGRFRDRL